MFKIIIRVNGKVEIVKAKTQGGALELIKARVWSKDTELIVRLHIPGERGMVPFEDDVKLIGAKIVWMNIDGQAAGTYEDLTAYPVQALQSWIWLIQGYAKFEEVKS